jgi:2-phosphoglycerate kinase
MQSVLRDEAGNAESLRRRLRRVYWIGGGSGAGKSTISRLIAEKYGMRVYATDEIMPDHARRMPPDQAPHLSKFAAMTMDERWVTRTPQEMLDTFHWFHGEGFRLIVDDLLQISDGQPVIAEGFRLLPELVKPLLVHPRQAVWLLPTPEFRRAVFDSRGGPAWGFVAKTGDPQRALGNLLERDRMFTDRIRDQTRQLDLTSMMVDPAFTDEHVAQRVAAAFGLDG